MIRSTLLWQVKALAGVDPFHRYDPVVGQQPVVQLAPADIDGVHARRSTLQHAVGEPAG